MDQTWKTSLNVPITVITTISLSLCCSCSPGYRIFPNICLFFLCYFRCVEAVWEWLIADEWVRRETHTLIVILSPLCVCVFVLHVCMRERKCWIVYDWVDWSSCCLFSGKAHIHTHTPWCIWSPGIIFTHHLTYKNQSGLFTKVRDMGETAELLSVYLCRYTTRM